MNQEIEIEFKTVITAQAFSTLLGALPFPANPIRQVNHYFDRKDMALKNIPAALRIREIGENFTLTLKQPQEEGILETHEALTKNEAYQWLNGIERHTESIGGILEQSSIAAEDLEYYGALTTERYTFKENGIEFVLDHSHYLGHDDYELEIEASTWEEGQESFDKLLENFQIKAEEPISKIARFFAKLNQA